MKAPEDYKPEGVVSELEGKLPIYEVGTGSKAIIVFPEVFCWEGRLKGVCDHFASTGYYVIMPDIMRGDSMSLPENQADSNGYLSKWAQWDRSEDSVKTVFDHVAGKGITEICSVGFCWGGWVLFKASAGGFPIKCGAICHPSIRLEGFAGSNEVVLSGTVKCPMMFASGRNDPENVKEGGECSKILAEKFPTSEAKGYAEVDHGWVTRGDISDAVVARNVREALAQTDAFLAKHM